MKVSEREHGLPKAINSQVVCSPKIYRRPKAPDGRNLVIVSLTD